MASSASFTGPRGMRPSDRIAQLQRAATVTTGDILAAGQLIRTAILENTQAGVDVNGAAFAPYSPKGPYYFYPGGSAGGRSVKQRKASVGRVLRQTGNTSSLRGVHFGELSIGGTRTRSGVGIRFESYGDAHRSMGRGTVDLFGIHGAPHMLLAIVIKVGGFTDAIRGSVDSEPALRGRPEPAPPTMTIGFYGDEAGRAQGHNEGTRNLPRRRFFGASQATIARAMAKIRARIDRRMQDTAA